MSRLLSAMSLPAEGLTLFRRGLAVLCLLDVAQRLTQVSLLYSDLGLLPRYALFSLFPAAGSWSLYRLSGHPVFVASLMVLTIALAARQIMRRSPRWSRVALWALVLSVQQRNPAVNDASDDLLRLLLFWDIFLPEQTDGDTVSLATLGVQWQLTLALLATGVDSSRHWLLAAQWGQAVEAVRFPWLGHVVLLAIPAIWWAPSRRYLMPMVAVALLLQAVLLDPVFPLTMGCGLLCLWCPPSRMPGVEIGPDWRPAATLAWASACLAALLWTAFPGWADSRLSLLGDSLGWRQRWSRIYPLAEPVRGEVLLRVAGYARPVFSLDLRSGRRLRLLSQALLADSRLATPLAQSFAESMGTPRSVAVWLKTDWFDEKFSLPRQEVRQLEAVHARPGAEVEEQT